VSGKALPAGLQAPAHNRWIILANVSLGTFMSTLDSSIANVALPTMSRELAAPVHLIQWVLTAYLLTICATLPIMGKLSDMWGRTRVYQFGFLLFAFGSALCGLSHSLGLLIGSRIVQALGAACLMSNSQAIVAQTFSGGDRGRALGIIGTVVSLGSLTGPGIGGLIVERFGWPMIFWINVPIGILACIAGQFILPKDSASKREPFDYAGSGLFIVGMTAFLYTLSNAQDWGWAAPATIGGLVGSIAVFVIFYLWEKRSKFPMLDFSLYRIPAFALGNVTALLVFASNFFTTVLMPFFMENVLSLSVEHTGYMMMVYPMTMAVVAPLSGYLSDRMGSKLLTTAGLLAMLAGFACLLTLNAGASLISLAVFLAIFGMGSGLFQSPNNASVMGAVPPTKLGSAGGLNALARNVGMVLGTSVSVSIYATGLQHFGGGVATPDPHAMMNALRLSFAAGGAVCLIALAVSSRRLKL